MSKSLTVLSPASEHRPIDLSSAAGVKVALVNMPFSSSRRPSIQLGILHALLQRHAVDVRSHYLNLLFASRIGWELADELCTGRSGCLVGEWLFAGAAFGGEAPDPQVYLDRFAAELSTLTDSGLCPEDLLRLREEEVPRFLDACLDAIDWGQYRVVGFTSVFEQNCAAIALARRIKERHPHVITVFGGVNFEDEMGVEYASSIPWIDYAVIGEGDLVFPEFLAEVGRGADPIDIPGVAYTRDGRLHYRPNMRPLEDLDTSPEPNYDDFFAYALKTDLPEFVGGAELMLSYQSARGCWWGQKNHCTFCSMNKTQMVFRAKSPERVLDEIDGLARRYGIYLIGATDEILDLRYIDGVFEKLYEQRRDYSLYYDLKSNIKPHQLRTLARGGLRFAQPGIESLSTNVLKLMRKGITGIDQVRFLKWAAYYGISCSWFVLRGFPGETPQDYEQQLATLRLIPHFQPPQGAGTVPVRLEKFSPHYDRADEFGFANVRPSAPYACIYPDTVDRQKIALFFDCDPIHALPEETFTEIDAQLKWWCETWRTTDLSMVYERGHSTVTILDNRDPQAPDGVVLTGADALLYEACNVSGLTPKQVSTALEGKGDVAVEEIEPRLEALAARGLMLQEGKRFLSLAHPANRNW